MATVACADNGSGEEQGYAPVRSLQYFDWIRTIARSDEFRVGGARKPLAKFLSRDKALLASVESHPLRCTHVSS